MSDKGKKYGTEYKTVLKASNIKFIRQTETGSVKAPMETMTKGRVYATIDGAGRVNSITYYDDEGKRRKSINLLHGHKNIRGPHTHEGYNHSENGTHRLTAKEKVMVDFVFATWNNKNSRS